MILLNREILVLPPTEIQTRWQTSAQASVSLDADSWLSQVLGTFSHFLLSTENHLWVLRPSRPLTQLWQPVGDEPAPSLTYLHVFLLHGLIVGRMLSQVPARGTQVVDVAGASLHAAGIVHETGQLPGRQCRGLVSQQLCNILLQTKGRSLLVPGYHSESLLSSWALTREAHG